MLASLVINNIVLIDRLTVEFQKGFCALTGETGAGKSILLDSLALALGMRAESGLVRKGAEQGTVSAEFHVGKKHAVNALLAGQGLEGGETIILRRTISADGRSRAFINDQPVSVALLREAGALLVEIHGQFDTHGLLDGATHGLLLDDYAGIDRARLAALWDAWRQAENELQRARDDALKAQSEEDYLRSSVSDLDELAPQCGEEVKLASLKEKLKRRDQVLENFSVVRDGLDVAEDTINAAYRALEKTGEDAKPLLDGMDRAINELREVAVQVQSLSADLSDNEYSLSEIDDRLFALRTQARKHNCACDDLPAKRDDLARRLSLIERQDEVLDAIRKKLAQAHKAFADEARAVSVKRAQAAEKLDRLVAKELPPLKLEKARFVTAVEKLPEEKWTSAGMDYVRFLIAANPGAEPGPLNKIASGGEMARFMLALKVVMAEAGAAGTYVFDEVDSGIGGPTAAAVGERLARLAAKRQILVVTHSPQVAARAQHHWIVVKDGKKDITTKVLPLAVAARQEEIARMLSGAEVTAEARAAADRLLKTGT